MPYTAKKIQDFKATINNIKFSDEQLYRSTCYILDEMDDFGYENYNDAFIKDLASTIETIILKYDDSSYSKIENYFVDSIMSAESNGQSFEDLQFLYENTDWKFEQFNRNIKTELYKERNL